MLDAIYLIDSVSKDKKQFTDDYVNQIVDDDCYLTNDDGLNDIICDVDLRYKID